MNNQEAFDKIVEHLAQQKEPAVQCPGKPIGNAGNFCRYRAPDGKKCAVGVLIPDELYDEGMETKGVPSILEGWENLHEFLQGVDLTLLFQAQLIHDDIPPSRWEERFLSLGDKYNLNTDKVGLLHDL